MGAWKVFHYFLESNLDRSEVRTHWTIQVTDKNIHNRHRAQTRIESWNQQKREK